MQLDNYVYRIQAASAVGVLSIGLLVFNQSANATLISLGDCTGASSCEITDDPPNPITKDPNDGILLAWDEVQNLTLESQLTVDRVHDENADFIEEDGNDFLIKAGTIVSSHYFQWDPGNSSEDEVVTTITLDSQVFAFIIDDDNLFASDNIVGLESLDYANFNNRGLETNDTTSFNDTKVDIEWGASSPGDWTRLITAESPGAEPPPPAAVPSPATLALFAIGMAGIGFNGPKGSKRREPVSPKANRIKAS